MTSSENHAGQNENTPNSEGQSDNQSGKSQSEIAPAGTEPKAKPTKSNCQNSRDDKKHWLDYVTAGLEIIGLIVLCIYAAYTIKIYCANKKSADAAKDAADIAREALTDVQRAFVYDSFNQGQDGNFLRITVGWENSGTTPTRNMTMHMSHSSDLRSKPLANNFSFPDTWEGGEARVPTRLVIPAKGRGQGIEVRIPLSLISTAAANRKESYYYVWGWARYRDIFPKTPEHIIRFCEEFTSQLWSPDAIHVHTVGMDACAKYNCVDEECQHD